MYLKQTLKNPVNGYWDGGAKQEFEWRVHHHCVGQDKRGKFVKVGSFDANHWFHVSLGKTEKETLRNAMRHLRKHTRIESSFKIINED
jgi:hypothetical protein